VRLIHKVGPSAVIQAARQLGISGPIPEEASIALGTSTVSLLELTSAYASIAKGAAPVRPIGLAEPEQRSWFAALRREQRALGADELKKMRDLLASAVRGGTGYEARLPVAAYGKTGTTQDSRDVWFIGYAGDLVAGVWIGNDDNTPNYGLTSHLPSRIWRDFMAEALGVALPEPPPEESDELTNMMAQLSNSIGDMDVEIDGDQGAEVHGPNGTTLRIGRDGIQLNVPNRAPPPPRPDERDRRRDVPPDEAPPN
jgi:penicillin-binding protein 1A